LKTDKYGHSIAVDLTDGEKGDCPHFPVLLDLGPDIRPRAAFGDKGYDSKANRALCRKRSIATVILQKSNAKDQSAHFPKILYKARVRIDIAVSRLKRFMRIALRCEKTARNFGSLVALVAGFNLIQFVHIA
jgi:transposase